MKKDLPKPLNTMETYLHDIAQGIRELNVSLGLIVDDAPVEEVDSQCIANTKAGNRCKSQAINGTKYCGVHGKE